MHDPSRKPRPLRAVWRTAGRGWLAVVLSGVISLLAGAAITAVRVPVPKVHDEFSYLLAADTFAQGRATNPTHPMWKHFESFHIIQQPSYACKYPPAQGLFLAFGQFVFGHPVAGVWLATALAAAAVCWLLLALMPGRWALVGGLLVAVHPSLQFHWGQSYWGGAVAMLGGALVFGAAARLRKTLRTPDALLLALGIGILANSRPFEGLIVTCCALVWLVAGWAVRLRTRQADKPPGWNQLLCRVVLPGGCLLAAIGAADLWYNRAVTGSPWRMPYSVHEATYAVTPVFLWRQPADVPDYRHPVMAAFHPGWAVDAHRRQQTLAGFVQFKGNSLLNLWAFYLGAVLTVPLVMARHLLRNRKLRFAVATLAVVLVASLAVPWLFPHYLAPAAPLLVLVLVVGLRMLSTRDASGRRPTRPLVGAVLLVQCIVFAAMFVQHARAVPTGWQWQRARLLAQLKATPGRHLVLVHYDGDHDVHAEWVYNRADIDAAQVVWARPFDPVEDERLIRYFSDRRIWTLNADADPPTLVEQTR